MSATIVLDAQGRPVSIGTVVANPLPAGCTAVSISDADFAAIRVGEKVVGVNGVLTDTGRAQAALNAQAVRDFLAAAGPTLQAIIDTPQVTFSNLSGAQTAARVLQGQVQDIARGLRRVRRMLIDDYTGTD